MRVVDGVKGPTMKPTKEQITEAVTKYREAVRFLEELKATTFKPGTPVMVNAQKYKGPGFVAYFDNPLPDMLSVKLPNGNTWSYPLECCTPVDGKG